MSDYKLAPYDLCIVGSGLIGSSAARHASLRQGVRVCLIGPDEPKGRGDTDVFGAWFDEGRITRSTASDTLWAQLASRSIARYRDLERATGIPFYSEVGCLTIAAEDDAYLASSYRSATAQGIPVSRLTPAGTAVTFPYLGLTPRDAGVLETADAGWINPRALRQAELEVAQRHGCDVVSDVVRHVAQDAGAPSGNGLMRVETDGGTVIHARKVLLAVGAFSEFRNLLPKGVKMDLSLKTQAVIFAELGADDQEKLKDMPSIVYKSARFAEGMKEEDDKYDCYILPPIKYPDGKTYLKLGHGAQYETPLRDRRDVIDWYTRPPPTHITDGLRNMVSTTFPGISPRSYHTDTCVTSHTPNNHPYVDMVTPNLGVALGGNGYAAKSCDELGKVAAEMMLSDKWSYDIPQDMFKMVLKTGNAKL